MSAFCDTQQITDETLSGHDTLRKSSVVAFPRFRFVPLTRECWNGQYHQKDSRPIVFTLNLAISHYCTDKTKRQPCQIAHEWAIILTSSVYRGNGYEETDVIRVNQSEAVEENFSPEQRLKNPA
jgi:hypothetical protein